MPPISPTAHAVARRLLARAGGTTDNENAPDSAVAAGTRLMGTLAEGLIRWFGPDGYNAILTRALAEARKAHPALSGVGVRSATDPTLDGLGDALMADARAAEEGVGAILAAIVELLSRLIGEDLAVSLLEQTVPSAVTEKRAENKESQP